MRDLFKRNAKAFGQQFQIMAQRLGGIQKTGIGHKRRPREIIRQPDFGDGARLIRAKARKVKRGFKQRVMVEQGDLVAGLKSLRGRAGVR